ncbi:RNA-directed DNA polymerase, eukaryota, reverse transcriptase zinc-binding domain protein [Tanacetum coccineum]
MDLNEDNKHGVAVIQQPPKEEVDNKVSNPDRKAEPSDLSRPPGFEFMKKSSSSSKCSTSFARFRKKHIKGVSLIHELNQIIDVGSSLGYDVRVVKRGKEENECGSKIFTLNTIMDRGLSGGLISMWDPNLFSKEAISLQDFIHHHHGSYIMFGDMNAVRNEQERVGSIFNNTEADHLNSFIDATGLVDLPLGGRSFTWMTKAGTKLSKLDPFLILENVIDLLPDIRITALDRIWSDHNPILLHVEKIDLAHLCLNCITPDSAMEQQQQSLDRNRKTAAIEELSSIEKKIDAVLVLDIHGVPGLNLVFHLQEPLFWSMIALSEFSINQGVNEEEVYNMASNTGCTAGNIPFNYLGLLIGSNMKSIASWKICFKEEPRYNRLYRLDQDKDCLIIDCIINGNWHWNWSRTNLGARNLSSFRDMLNEIGPR